MVTLESFIIVKFALSDMISSSFTCATTWKVTPWFSVEAITSNAEQLKAH